MQHNDKILPLFLNMDVAYELLQPNESPYIKDLAFDINGNPEQGTGTNNPTGEGQNLLVLTPLRANKKIDDIFPLPSTGVNKNIGSFYSDITQELYYFNYNSELQHGIYVADGNTLTGKKVIVDSKLRFSDAQQHFIAQHRVRLRIVKDAQGNIIEKYLFWTDGQKWQGWLNVNAAALSDGFNDALYPYWRLMPPHFDREELFEWPVRPPMIKPLFEPIPNTDDDRGKINRIIDKAFQVAFDYVYTDGRYTKASPYSLPVIIKSEDFLNDPNSLPKNAKITMYAGSCMVEKIRIYVRQCNSDWRLYDTINKFTDCGANSHLTIGNEYWKRTNPWDGFNYDPIFNTIEYIFDNSKVSQLIDQAVFLQLQNDIPQLSYALTDVGDAALLTNNRYGYPNFGCEVLDNFDITVEQKANANCDIPTRNMYVYAYVGRCGNDFHYTSQVGYFVGDDPTIKFGGVAISSGTGMFFNPTESNTFNLNFADKNAFICYLKGTPYYAVGELYQVNSDNTLVKVENKLDFSDISVQAYVGSVFLAQGFFVWRFHFVVPAGRYIATIGRHNVNLSGDWKNTSTYIIGIANSTAKTFTGSLQFVSIKPHALGGPNAIVTYSKEMELDCTGADVDVWGNGADLFYIYCPYIAVFGNEKFRFIEGYLRESQSEPIPIELFPYQLNKATDDSGQYTDKNGFYFAYTKVHDADNADVVFTIRLNCAYPTNFTVITNQAGSGWKPNGPAYLDNYNGGVVGECNRVLYRGKITNLDGTIGYSNISISMKDGATSITRQDGTFEMIVHNGQNTGRNSNVYINAGGNYIITTSDCGYIPLDNFAEVISPCTDCTERIYPIPLNRAIVIQSLSGQTSLKEAGKYSVAIYGGDLAGRLMFVNVINDVPVPSFMERNNVNATFFRALINSALDFSLYPDMKWLTFSASKNITISRYLQWVGDEINYIDSNGNVVQDSSTAVFCSIKIDSLYNYNISRNFSVLATYQFVKGDRLRILDNGEGQLFDTATYGDPIDLQIEGTNYNQAAVNAGILPVTSVENPSQQTIDNNQSITLLVRYDSRLDRVIDKNGFWIELYTPVQESDQIPFCEVAGFYPIINGKLQEFTGYNGTQPVYQPITSVDLEFWDTYLIYRSITIPDVGNKFISHPFESPNISDNWGAGCTSCGRQNIKNENAKQVWVNLDSIRSDPFFIEGSLNGLGVFKEANRKLFKEAYSWGAVIATYTQGSAVAFICENNFFVTDYNFQYIFANAQGIQIANLDDNLGNPHQKIGDWYGVSAEDTGSVIFHDKFAFWYDAKNSAWVEMNYNGADDLSKLFVSSYFNEKTKFIKGWNQTADRSRSFDVIAGIDAERNNIYVTFRNRKNNTNSINSYINDRRNVDVKASETIVYNMDVKRWCRFTGFAPESYGMLKGANSGLDLIAFAAGAPYRHNDGNQEYSTYFGVKTTPVVIGIINKEPSTVKILEDITVNSNNISYWMDLIYSNEINSFSYVPLNLFKKKENMFYAAVLRNMNSYPEPNKGLYQSMMLDGKRLFGAYFVCRFIFNMNKLGKYAELKGLEYTLTTSGRKK